jgi:hypothetical protein
MQIPRLRTLALVGLALLTAAFLTLRFVSENTPDRENLPRLQLGKTETRSGMGRGMSTRAPEHGTFNSGRILLLSDNPHPFCRKIVTHLERRLKDSPHIRTVERLKEPFTITQRDGAPDLFLRVDLVSAKGGGVLTSTFKSVVSASLGSEPWSDTTHYTADGSNAARVIMDSKSTVESETTFAGLSSDRYDAPARDIAKSLADSITGDLAELSEEHPPMPSLPPEFFGPFEPVADFDWLGAVSARRAASYCGLFTHNETYWTFQTPTNPLPTIEGLAQSLKRTGWSTQLTALEGSAYPRLEARQGESWITIFRSRPRHESLDADPTDPQPLQFIVHHRKTLSRAERSRALELLLERSPLDFEALAPFEWSFEADQRRRFLDRLTQTGPSSPRACLRLANHFLDLEQTNHARHQLLKVHSLSATRPASESLTREITDLARKIQPEARWEPEYTPEICRELGFIEIEKVTQPMEFTRSFGEPLVFFGPFDHTLRISAVTVNAPRNDIYPVQEAHAERGMRGVVGATFSGRHGPSHSEHTFRGGLRTVTVRSEALPENRGARFTVRPEPDPPGTP